MTHAAGQHLAQLNTPLVEAVDVPHKAMHKQVAKK
jgi:hypothetical protein